MGARLQIQMKASPTRSFTPAFGRLLQRKCAADSTSGSTGECEDYGKQHLSLQPETRSFEGAPPIVHEALPSPGRPLDVQTRAFMEPRFGHDFSRVRLHNDRHATGSGTEGEPPTSVLPRFAQVSKLEPSRPNAHSTIQPTLYVSTPGNTHEQEADRVAEEVMRMPKPRLSRNSGGGGFPHSQDEQATHKFLQANREETNYTGETPSIVHEVIHSSGQPLDPSTREFMEPRFGHDFSQVRVHTDERASQSARAVNALAYTVGNDVVFARGRHELGTSEGAYLLAHELTHVLQQSGGGGLGIQRQDSTKKPVSTSVTTPTTIPTVSPPAGGFSDEKAPTIELSRGILQFVSEGDFKGGDTDSRRPHYPQNVGVFQKLTDDDKKQCEDAKTSQKADYDKEKKAAEDSKKKFTKPYSFKAPFDRYTGPDDIKLFTPNAAGDYKLIEKPDRHAKATYTKTLTADQQLGVLPTSAGSQSGLTIGLGLDMGVKFKKTDGAKAKTRLITAGVGEKEAGLLSSAVGLKGLEAAKKAAEIRPDVTLTSDQVIAMLGEFIPDFDKGYPGKKKSRPYTRGDGTFHPAVEEALMNLTYWGREDYWRALYQVTKDKTNGVEQLKAGRDATKKWSTDKYYEFFSVIVEIMEAGNDVTFLGGVKTLDELTGATDKTFETVRDIRERMNNFQSSRDIKKELGKGELDKLITNTVGVNSKDVTEGWNLEADIRNVQQMLYNGDYDVEVNGQFDVKTKDAIIKFNTKNGSTSKYIKPGSSQERRLRTFKYKKRTA